MVSIVTIDQNFTRAMPGSGTAYMSIPGVDVGERREICGWNISLRV